MRYFLFCYLLFAACPPRETVNSVEAGVKPNVLILYTDDQRWNTIRAWGNEEIHTPNLDRLARLGTSFTRAHVTGGNHGAICAFSRAMLLTGRPFQHIPASFANPTTGECPLPTMPEVLAEQGYRTYFTGKWHNKPPELVAGFDEGKNIFLGGMHFPKNGGHFKPELYHKLDKTGQFPASKKIQRDTFSSKLYADATIDFINAHSGDNPFFIYTSFTSPHDPRTPPPPFDKMYDPEKIKLPPNFMVEHPFDMGIRTIRDEELLPYPRTEEAVQKEIALYYGMISEVDAEIGRILDVLEAKDLLRNTIIVFAGDNGLGVGQHGLLGKQNLYDHSARVPLIIAGPGVPGGQNTRALASIHDIFPTVTELSGVTPPPTVEGLSLVPAIKDPGYVLRESLLLAYTGTQRAIRSADDWKLIHTRYDGKDHFQLYDIKNDPWEMKNLAAIEKYRSKFEEMNLNLQSEIIAMGDGFYQPVIEVSYTAFGQPPKIAIQAPGDGLVIHYTTDGSDPMPASPFYTSPFLMLEGSVIKARTYHQGVPVSPVVETSAPVVDKFGKMELENAPSSRYRGRGAFTLADGLRGSDNFQDGKWLGYHGEDAILTVDLGKKQDISTIRIGYFSNPGNWIFPPVGVKVYNTDNQEHFVKACEWKIAGSAGGKPETKIGEIKLDCDIAETRFLKIVVENQGVCPAWHAGSGGKAWLFIDELDIE